MSISMNQARCTAAISTIALMTFFMVGGCAAYVDPGSGSPAQTTQVAKKSSALATGYWDLQGNSGTTAGSNFLGTTDVTAFEIKVNSARALRIEPGSYGPNIVGGYSGNQVTDGATNATIAGGGNTGAANVVSDSEGTIGGGLGNVAGDQDGNSGSAYAATVGGGQQNGASAYYASVGGGYENNATGQSSRVGGGQNNTAAGVGATVAGGVQNSTAASSTDATVAGGNLNYAAGNRSAVLGGFQNHATGDYSAALGGYQNHATGAYSAALGNQAWATKPGCFVWSDSTRTFDTECWLNNQWLTITTGGTYIYTDTAGSVGVYVPSGSGSWHSASSRTVKNAIQPVDTAKILQGVSNLPMASWSYKTQPGVRHIGPMAEDFYAQFKTGTDDKSIAVVDEEGVALAAIQGLDTEVKALQKENEMLKARLDAIETKLGAKP